MQSAAQRDATRSGAGGSGQGERSQRFRADLVHWKWQANYWRSQHARAKERIAEWQAKWKATQQELADALQKLRGLRQQVQVQQENEGLRQENKQLLQSPFKKRSEKSKASQAAARGERAGGAASRGRARARHRNGGAGGSREGCASPGGSLGPGGAGGGARAGGRPLRVSGLRAALQPQRRGGQRGEVTGHMRRIRRPRYRASCECARQQGKAAAEVIAPLEPALFRGTSYGLSVWLTLLIQVYWQRRPVRAFEREWADCGVRLPAGTLLGHVADFLTWFEPLDAAIGAHQEQALCVHGDETSWVVHVWAEAGENPRGWMWVCVSVDAVRFRVDRSRSAAAAGKLFGQLGQEHEMVLVCDRYAAYVRLAREHPGQFVLAICWVHVRRDYVKVGRSRPDLQEWVEGILERIGRLYRLNAERLAEWDPQRSLEQQSQAFQAAHQRLQAECEALFAQAQREVQALTAAAGKESSAPDPRLGPLQSMLNHREGLEVFLTKPFVPMDKHVPGHIFILMCPSVICALRQGRSPLAATKLSHRIRASRGSPAVPASFSSRQPLSAGPRQRPAPGTSRPRRSWCACRSRRSGGCCRGWRVPASRR